MHNIICIGTIKNIHVLLKKHTCLPSKNTCVSMFYYPKHKTYMQLLKHVCTLVKIHSHVHEYMFVLKDTCFKHSVYKQSFLKHAFFEHIIFKTYMF
jgi:hypothetical protein